VKGVREGEWPKEATKDRRLLFTAVHFLLAFGHLAGEFSCCLKESGCVSLNTGGPRNDAVFRLTQPDFLRQQENLPTK
jgi:hypothetical protein